MKEGAFVRKTYRIRTKHVERLIKIRKDMELLHVSTKHITPILQELDLTIDGLLNDFIDELLQDKKE
jgi:hypothetical protein